MNRTILACVTGLWGAMTMVAMLWPDGAGLPSMSWTLCAFAGAAVAGAVLAPWFCKDHPGWTLVAIVLATTIGAGLAAPFALSAQELPQSIALGPAFVWATILQSPSVGLVWLAGAIATRLIAYSLK